MDKFFSNVAAKIAAWAGQPAAFILAAAVVIIWGVSGPVFRFSDTWQLVINTGTTIITFLMVFLIQNAQNRDASAMQVKLDELLRAVQEARNEFIGIEHLTDAELIAIREALENSEACKGESEQGGVSLSRADILARLLLRR
ncbi:MAG TPA: low affinity iron permease family protein [Sphingobium sp.]|uniref:low affinity iron permease family protein n=1 Tax=Sphingobium sp. TaxID=1912891 RepID=UPI002ED35715